MLEVGVATPGPTKLHGARPCTRAATPGCPEVGEILLLARVTAPSLTRPTGGPPGDRYDRPGPVTPPTGRNRIEPSVFGQFWGATKPRFARPSRRRWPGGTGRPKIRRRRPTLLHSQANPSATRTAVVSPKNRLTEGEHLRNVTALYRFERAAIGCAAPAACAMGRGRAVRLRAQDRLQRSARGVAAQRNVLWVYTTATLLAAALVWRFGPDRGGEFRPGLRPATAATHARQSDVTIIIRCSRSRRTA